MCLRSTHHHSPCVHGRERDAIQLFISSIIVTDVSPLLVVLFVIT